MIAAHLQRPWLIAELIRPMRVLSWAPHRPGFVTATRIVWREVRNADLPLGFDVETWFYDDMRSHPGAVGMMTSRDIGTFTEARAEVEGIRAGCVATVGLTNGESVGRRRKWSPQDFGTINLAVAVGAALTEAAQLEAMSIAVQARTAAVMQAKIDLPTGQATGTGTDCVALACDPGDGRYAGLHTAVGEAVGAVVKAAVAKGAEDWKAWYAMAMADSAARAGAQSGTKSGR